MPLTPPESSTPTTIFAPRLGFALLASLLVACGSPASAPLTAGEAPPASADAGDPAPPNVDAGPGTVEGDAGGDSAVVVAPGPDAGADDAGSSSPDAAPAPLPDAGPVSCSAFVPCSGDDVCSDAGVCAPPPGPAWACVFLQVNAAGKVTGGSLALFCNAETPGTACGTQAPGAAATCPLGTSSPCGTDDLCHAGAGTYPAGVGGWVGYPSKAGVCQWGGTAGHFGYCMAACGAAPAPPC